MRHSRLVALVAILAAGQALAADMHSVMQKDQAFSTPSLEINAGDTVMWGNADDIMHNIAVIAPDGGDQDLGNQAPRVILKHTFDTAGKYRIICHVHPKMKMTVLVK